MADVYGLIGYPLAHSFSPAYFNHKFASDHIDAVYSLFPIYPVSEVRQLFLNCPNLRGLNVTIPYKQSVIPYLDLLDPVAQSTGAVNCISFKNGVKTGHNTDVVGFRDSLLPMLQPQRRRALILGTGGAARAVAYVLHDLNIGFSYVSRTRGESALTYEDLSEEVIKSHTLIINTTPLGMYPSAGSFPPISYAAITSRHLLYDLVYNPPETLFLKKGKAQGSVIKNGLEMLRLQADASWKIWRE